MQSLQDAALAWAAQQPDIRAVVRIGSFARSYRPADALSDLDLILFTRTPARYRAWSDWIGGFGPMWLNVPAAHDGDDCEQMAIYEGGYKVDMVFFNLERLEHMAAAQAPDHILGRGYVTLLDRDGLLAQIPPAPTTSPPGDLPDGEAYRAVVTRFWYSAAQVAKYLWRGQLWVTKLLERRLQDSLLTMLEWHARALNGPACDTWIDGRFMADWADPAAYDALHETFAHFDAADTWRALDASMTLFRRLATETAGRTGFTYPAELDAQITAFVAQVRAGDLAGRT
jgi:aminoglycoside 6-adenylyltransferase